jgi:hypothetical protein
MADKYKHTPLPGKEYIRVLELKPRKKVVSVECELKVVNLSAQLRDDQSKARSSRHRLKKINSSVNLLTGGFEALSYQWGKVDPDCFIICNGKRLCVTPNCRNALLHLQQRLVSRRLWVDAICIDQSEGSKTERDQQLGRMGEIYAAASRVIAWLGPGGNGSEPAMGYLKGFGKFLRTASSHPSMSSILRSSIEGFDNADEGTQKLIALGELY